MPKLPEADLGIGREHVAALVSALVAEPHEDVDEVRWTIAEEPAGEGWDNLMWPVGQRDGRGLVLRVARRRVALPLLERELVVLRHLAGQVTGSPMDFPAVLAAGPGAVLMPWLQGRPAAELPVDDLARVGHTVAVTLASLHSVPPPGMVLNSLRGVPLATRAAAFEADLVRIAAADGLKDRARQLWDRGIAAPDWTGPALLMHGDPHPGNVVVPEGGGRPALIDWGDATAGDPASDLGALLLFDPSGAVLSTYQQSLPTGHVVTDEDVWQALSDRAWAWAARMSLSLLSAYAESDALGSCAVRMLGREAQGSPPAACHSDGMT